MKSKARRLRLGHRFVSSGIRFKGQTKAEARRTECCMHETVTPSSIRVCGRKRSEH